MGPPDQISVDCVRVRGSRESPAVTRLRTSHLLATARLQPAAMPPSAVLVIRALADPLPGRIAGQGQQPAATVSREWESAVQDRLGELYARAARPAFGSVAPSVEAVLFADYAELIACLAVDVSSGAGSAWWWQSILKRYSGWTRLWEEQAVYVPAALEHLTASGHAVAVLERIAPLKAWRIAAAVARAFDLPASCLARHGPAPIGVVAVESSIPGGVPEKAAAGRDSNENAVEGTRARRPPRLPWEPYVPPGAVPEALGLEKRVLLGLGLLLRRWPAVALTPEFPVRLATWLFEQSAATTEMERRPTDSPRTAHVSAPAAEARIDRAAPEKPPSKLEPREDSQSFPVSQAAEMPAPAHSVGPPLAPVPRPRRDSRPNWGIGAATRLGGVLYLIHLLRQADLVRHFDTGLSGWALLDLIARCLLSTKFSADPIWEALADLDGRDPQFPPGIGFRPQRTYTAPAAWLRSLDERPPLVRFRSRGVEVWRPEGFLVLDSTASSARGLPVPRHLRRAVDVRPAGIPLCPGLHRFLHFVLPYVRWRLARALRGMSIEELLFRRGKLTLSSTHIDLMMNMRQISIPIRAAGLDANPGWAPELGRIVTFHFVPEGQHD